MEQPKSGFAARLFSALLKPVLKRLDKPSLPRYAGTLPLGGLTHKVEVRWSSHGVPHVFAADEPDLFLAQGYLHAQERLWQMEMSRRFLSGRLAELFGDFTVPWKELSSHFRGADATEFDYFVRLIGIRRAAAASLDLLDHDDVQRLEAYSQGINRYIETCGKKLPWEFRVLRHEPEPWRPVDCLTIGKGLAFLLSTALFTRLNMIALAAKLHSEPEKLRSLFPSHPHAAPTITRAVWDSAESLWKFVNGTFAASEWHPAGHGSNNWVLAPSRSVTAAPILCNDPHLRLTLPAVWYLMHLKAEPDPSRPAAYETWGASIPGTPCIQIGHNRRIAWGITAALCDDVEIYRESVHPLEPSLYLSGHQWMPFTSWEEQIRIRGKRAIKRLVRATRHGPILSDFGAAGPPPAVLSMRWTAHEPGRDFHCVYGINCAGSWEEFLNSLACHGAPTLNYLFADREGNIGYSLAGKIPRRAHPPSLLPLDGADESNEWNGYIPFTELPRVYNPPEGALATANHRIVDASYPYHLSDLFEPPYRIRRIQKLLAAKPSFSINDMAEMQMDLVSLHAAECIETLREDLTQLAEASPWLKPAADRLLGWDGRCHAQSVEAAIFHLFHRRLMANLLAPTLGEELFETYVEIFNQCLAPVSQILKDPSSPWFASRPRQQLVARSLRQACAELTEIFGAAMERWQWGALHTLTLSHSLARGRFLRALLSVGPFPSTGDGVTINMGFYRQSNPYAHTVGASFRFICDVGHWDQSRFILSSGQSGHLGSPYYADQTALWRAGDAISIRLPSETASAPHLIFEPPTSPRTDS